MLPDTTVERRCVRFDLFLCSSHILGVPIRPSEPEVNEKTAFDHEWWKFHKVGCCLVRFFRHKDTWE